MRESPEFASQLFLRMIKQCAHLLGHIKSHAIFPIYFLSSCGIARASAVLQILHHRMHIGEITKAAAALPSAAGRSFNNWKHSLTHTLSSRWKRASPVLHSFIFHNAHVLCMHSCVLCRSADDFICNSFTQQDWFEILLWKACESHISI